MSSEETPGEQAGKTDLDEVEAVLGYRFRDRSILERALVHASVAECRLRSNQRLEFLGDAVLGLVISDYLFHRYPRFLEGEMTHVKSIVVSRASCARVSERLRIYQFLRRAKNVGKSLAWSESMIADAWESLLGAIYLDGGLEAARQCILRHMRDEIQAAVDGLADKNYKSLLQNLAQRRYSAVPVYELIGQRGPDHDKSFQVVAKLGRRRFEPAWGKTKKEAEQGAAKNALEALLQDQDTAAEQSDADTEAGLERAASSLDVHDESVETCTDQ
ncbi:MAG: ribonuclease 3 [Pirellulaceae bacterium]|nr:MAG: ribonuclease 3 [Pirellulaceae bacterium]